MDAVNNQKDPVIDQCDSFTNKTMFDDVEMTTSDGKQMHFSKWWLCTVSPYFKEVLEKTTFQNNLGYPCKPLDVLFCCVMYSYKGDEEIKRYLAKLENINDVFDFFLACEEYQFNGIKIVADKYFANEEYFVSLCYPKDLSRLMSKLIYPLGLREIKKDLKKIIREDLVDPTLIDFTNVPLEAINLFVGTGWLNFLYVFTKLLETHNPKDEELVKARMDQIAFGYVPNKFRKNVVESVQKLTHADKFKILVYEKFL